LKPSTTLPILLLASAALIAVPAPAHATVVSFNTLSSAATDVLQIGGVTITGTDVATVFGTGLGVGDGSFDEFVSYNPADDSTNTTVDGNMSLSVDGRINSMTIMPFFNVIGGTPCPACNFEIGYRPQTGVPTSTNYSVLAGGTPVTLLFDNLNADGTLPVSLDNLGIYGDFGEGPYITSYITSNNFQPVSFSFGFSILSLDYTPTATPEPATLSLLALGSLTAAFTGRRRARAKRARTS
jgi:hypothetical protein